MTTLLGSKYFKYSEFLKDREIEYPLSDTLKTNMSVLLNRLDVLRHDWGKPMIISSGYRPGRFNKAAGGAPSSAHMTCEAVDIQDRDGELAKFLSEEGLLASYGFYMENPSRTPGWCHLQTRATKSGNRIFMP